MSAATTDLWVEFSETLKTPAAVEPMPAHAAAVTALPEEAKELGLLLYVVSVVLPAAGVL